MLVCFAIRGVNRQTCLRRQFHVIGGIQDKLSGQVCTVSRRLERDHSDSTADSAAVASERAFAGWVFAPLLMIVRLLRVVLFRAKCLLPLEKRCAPTSRRTVRRPLEGVFMPRDYVHLSVPGESVHNRIYAATPPLLLPFP